MVPNSTQRLRDEGGPRRGAMLLELLIAMTVVALAGVLLAQTTASRMRLHRSSSDRAAAVEAARRAIERMRAEPFEEVFARYNPSPEDDPEGVGTAPGHRFAEEGLVPLASAVDGRVGTIEFPMVFAVISDEKESKIEKDLREAREQRAEEQRAKHQARLDRKSELDAKLRKLQREQEAHDQAAWLAALPSDERKAAEKELKEAEKEAKDAEKVSKEAIKAAEKEREKAEKEAEKLAKEEAKRRSKEPYWQLREDVEDPELGMPRDLNGDGILTPRDRSEDYQLLPVRVTVEWQSETGPREVTLHTMLAPSHMEEAP